MLDDTTKRGRIILAALRLAEEKGWRRLDLADIARAAGVGLADVYARFLNKSAILEDFARRVDREVLKRTPPGGEDSARDRLFDVLMTRFEVLTPYKRALKRIARDVRASPALAAALCGASVRSQYWMLTAAGVRADAPEGCLRVPGMMAVYAAVMPVWLDDDDPGLARTMAALDRQLRRGERMVDFVEQVCDGAGRILCAFVPRRREREGRAAGPAPEAPPTSGPQPSPEPPRAA